MQDIQRALSFTFKVPELTDSQFKLFSDLIYSICGINLPPKKKLMLVSRLQKRLHELKIATFEEYYAYLSTPEGKSEQEIVKMLDVVSTNKTDFFREKDHFDYLSEKFLPEYILSGKSGKGEVLNIWSAGCSSGEEPYTIAMVLNEYYRRYKLTPNFKILATDISTKVLEMAKRAVYKPDVVKHMPDMLRSRYLIKEEQSTEGEYRIVPEIRKHVNIKRLNLMDSDFKLGHLMDIIFCRNVIIYFDRETQKVLFSKFYANLCVGGYLFIGNSETLHGINNDFRMIAPTIYRK